MGLFGGTGTKQQRRWLRGSTSYETLRPANTSKDTQQLTSKPLPVPGVAVVVAVDRPMPPSPPELLAAAVADGDANAVQRAIAAGADPSSAVYAASLTGQSDILRVLLGLGATVDAVTGAEPPLAAACRHNKSICVALLAADPRTDLESIGFDQQTPLMLAAAHEDPTCLEALLAHRNNDRGRLLDLERRDANGRTALDLASDNCAPILAEVLIDPSRSESGIESTVSGSNNGALPSWAGKVVLDAASPLLSPILQSTQPTAPSSARSPVPIPTPPPEDSLPLPPTTSKSPVPNPIPPSHFPHDAEDGEDDLMLTVTNSQPTNSQQNEVTSAHQNDFLHCCMVGSRAELEEFLADPVLDVNWPEPLHGQTAFTVACWRGRADVVQRLLDDGRADPNVKAEGGFTGLMFAAIEGHATVVKALLAGIPRVDLNVKNAQGGFDERRGRDKPGFVQSTLIADVRCFSLWSTGKTALILACLQKHSLCIKLLSRHPNTDLDLSNTECGNDERAIVERSALRRQHVQGINGKHPRRSESMINLRDANRLAKKTSKESLRIALIAESTSNAINLRLAKAQLSESALEVFVTACRDGDNAAVDWFLSLPNVNPNAAGREGWTGFQQACARGQHVVLDRLVRDPRVDPNLRDPKGRTGFYLACLGNHANALRVLLRYQDRVDVTRGTPSGIFNFEKKPYDAGNQSTKRLVKDGISRKRELLQARMDAEMVRERMEQEARLRREHEGRVERARVEEVKRRQEERMRMVQERARIEEEARRRSEQEAKKRQQAVEAAEFEAARRRQEAEERAIYQAQIEEQARRRRKEAEARELERKRIEEEVRAQRELARLKEELRIKRELLEVAELLARAQKAAGVSEDGLLEMQKSASMPRLIQSTTHGQVQPSPQPQPLLTRQLTGPALDTTPIPPPRAPTIKISTPSITPVEIPRRSETVGFFFDSVSNTPSNDSDLTAVAASPEIPVSMVLMTSSSSVIPAPVLGVPSPTQMVVEASE